jgi:DNA helicase-2/ATP-dependent DNA helicase PcrA
MEDRPKKRTFIQIHSDVPAADAVLERITRELNEQQLAAVTAPEKQALVLAGAGSGKTRVITYRVAYLLGQGLNPRSILLATFTNKAARMMLGRVEELTGIPRRRIEGGTFHHIGHMLLRRHAEAIGFRRDFTIIDEQDAAQLMKVVRKEAPVDFAEKLFPSARVLYRLHSLCINTGKPLEELIIYRFPQFARMVEEIRRVTIAYQERKRKQNVMDFDDLLVNTHELFVQSPETGATISRKFEHVLVDEYQDTNLLQAKVIKELSRVHGRVFAVGDDAQSIYAFRGANFMNILRFDEDYPEARIYKLETNYRSTPQILSVANAVMADIPEKFRKRLAPVRADAMKPALFTCADSEEQAQFIAEQILLLWEERVPLWEMGVLYRAHRHSLEIEMELAKRGIPYEIRGGLRFMEQAHIKDIVSFLSFVVNPRDEVALSRMLDMCEHVGSKTIAGILDKIRGAENPLRAFSHNGVAELGRGKGKASVAAITGLVRKLEGLNDGKKGPAELIRAVVEEFYDSYMQRTYENYAERREDVEQLTVYAEKYRSTASFVSEVALNQAYTAGQMAEEVRDTEEGMVSLSTIHQAKGLEWRAVFVAHLTEGALPHRMCMEDPEQMEEERRLFYVALTRAKDMLFLSYPQKPDTSDYLAFNRPSRFLQYIPGNLLEHYAVDFGEEEEEAEEKPG